MSRFNKTTPDVPVPAPKNKMMDPDVAGFDFDRPLTENGALCDLLVSRYGWPTSVLKAHQLLTSKSERHAGSDFVADRSGNFCFFVDHPESFASVAAKHARNEQANMKKYQEYCNQ